MTEGTLPNTLSPRQSLAYKTACCCCGAVIAGWALLILAIGGVMLSEFFG